MDKQLLQEREQKMIELAESFCKEHLNGEYAALCTKLIHKLGSMSPCPFQSGRLEMWAAASVYTICSINLMFDRRKPLSLSPSDISDYFGVSRSTITQKMRMIKELLKIDPVFDTEFILGENVKQPNLFNRLMKIFGFSFFD
jgi:hypothetical protein